MDILTWIQSTKGKKKNELCFSLSAAEDFIVPLGLKGFLSTPN